MSYLNTISVVYGDTNSSEPSNSIRVIGGESGDINKGFGGKFVWLVPDFSSGGNVTDVSIKVQSHSDPDYLDLAKDAGGDFRYIHLSTSGTTKITQIALLRDNEYATIERVRDLGYSAFSGDINQGRRGDFLHIIWS